MKKDGQLVFNLIMGTITVGLLVYTIMRDTKNLPEKGKYSMISRKDED